MSGGTGTELFMRVAATAQARDWVAEVLAKAPPQVRRRLLDSAESSAFSLSRWIEALVVFSAWLGSRKLSASVEDQIAYLECCAASAGAGAPLEDLPALLEEMLETHGCEAAR